MTKILTFGYGNRGVETLDAILAEHDAVIIDTRRFPKAWTNALSRPGLEKRYGDRYQFCGLLLGNGAKGGDGQEVQNWMVPPSSSAPGWCANVKDWWKLNLWHQEFVSTLDFNKHGDLVRFLNAGLREIQVAIGNKSPLFLCCEKDWRVCHRQYVANFAAAHPWPNTEIVHL